MTLIAGTIHKSFPVLMGDILITTEIIHSTQSNIMLPTYFGGDESAFLLNNKRMPVELKQKLYIITPKLCLALAGNLWYLKIFLEAVRDRFKYLKVTEDNVRKLCDEFDDELLREVNYIFFGNYFDGEKRSFFYYGSGINKSITHDYFGICSAAGSGAISFINEVIRYPSDSHKISNNSLSYQALCTNIYLITNFLLKEKVSTASIEEGWGCGFELICYNGESFYKIDNITYIYFKLTIQDGIIDFEKLTPFFIINFKYYEDLLKITAYDSKNVGTFLASPIDKKVYDVNRAGINGKFTFGTENVALCYFTDVSDRLPQIYKLLYHQGTEKNEKISIDIDYESKVISVAIDPEIHRSLFPKI
jgi:hypothetical protein